MGWIKVEHSTPTKPEILRMASILDSDQDAIFGKWMRLWLWLDANSVDGHVDGVAPQHVDALVALKGFSSAAISVGWLSFDETSQILHFPNFDRHNGETAKNRALKAKRQAKYRSGRGASVDSPPSTRPSTEAPPEKRREEKKSKSIGHFVPPTLIELIRHCNEKKYTFDPEAFLAHYEARGWKLNRGVPMKSWKAACVTWQKNKDNGSFTESKPPPQNSGPGIFIAKEYR